MTASCHHSTAEPALSTSTEPPLRTSSTAPHISHSCPAQQPPSATSPSGPVMSTIAIDHERVCLYQQFDDNYPIVLTPYLSRSAYRSHIGRINTHWRRASLLYLLLLVSFLTFALGPILLGAAVNEHALTGVDEEVGVAMLLLGVAGVVASVVLIRVCSRRMLLTAVAAENEKLKGSVPEMKFRVEHDTVVLPVKQVGDGAGASVQVGEQPQQRVESSEYRLLLEVGQLPAGAAETMMSAAVAEATLLSMSSHFNLDPTNVLYHPHHLCPHCLHDSPHSALPLYSLYPVAPLYPLPGTHPAGSPLLAAHIRSTLPHTAHMQPVSVPTARVNDVVIDVTRRDSDATHADPQPALVSAQ